jgi:polysaccharide chain length determinant protein (PEP-CTERM system associated)
MPEFSGVGDVFDERAARRPRFAALSGLSLFRALWKRRLLLCATWAGASAGVLVVVHSLPGIYRSEALVVVESQRIPERYVAATVNADLQDRLGTICQRILSYDRLMEIIQKFDLYARQRKTKGQEQLIERMRSDIRIAPVRGWSSERGARDGPGAFRVAYTGPDAAVVAQVANQLASYFIDENLRARELLATGTSEFLDNRLAEAKRRLEDQENRLSDYKQQYNGELPQQENALIASMGRLQLQLAGVQEAIGRTGQNRTILVSALASAQASGDALSRIAEQMEAAAGLGGLPARGTLSRRAALESSLQSLRLRYRDDHPDVRRLKAELSLLEDSPADTVAPGSEEDIEAAGNEQASHGPRRTAVAARNLAPQHAQSILRERERVAGLRAQADTMDEQLMSLEGERARLGAEIASLQKRIEKLPVREQQIAAVMRDYEISRANYQSLLDKKLSAEMATEMERKQKAERFTLLDPARVPLKPIQPNRPMLSLAGCAAGLLLGAILALGVEWKGNTLLGEWELPSGTPILGRVPRIAPDVRGSTRAPGRETGRRRSRRRRLLVLISSTLAFLLLGIAAAAGAMRFGWGGFF